MPKLFLGALLALVLAGCGPIEPPTARVLDGQTIEVVTTIGMITDIVEQVGGSRVHVQGLMGPGVDPHLYKASEGDLRRLEKADIVFYGGLHLEAKMADVLERIGERRATQAVTDEIPRSRLFRPAQFKGHYDPHVWFDVTLWMQAVEQVRDTLVRLDPGSAALYRQRVRLSGATAGARPHVHARRSRRCPAGQTGPDHRPRRLQLLRPRLRLRGARHAGDQHRRGGRRRRRQRPGRVHRGAADPRDLRRVVRLAAEDRARCVEARAGREATTSDRRRSSSPTRWAMPGTPEGTYIGMVRHNIDTIVKALQGLPARHRQSRSTTLTVAYRESRCSGTIDLDVPAAAC